MPYPTIPQTEADKVFTKATTQKIRNTNMGGHVQVSCGGYFYTVLVPPAHRAHITYREGWGGLESLHAVATPEQDHALRAAMKAQAAA